MRPGSPELPTPRRGRARHERRRQSEIQWRTFVVAIGVTVLLVAVLGTTNVLIGGGEPTHASASVSLAGAQTPVGTDTATTVAPAPTTAAPTTTEPPPTTKPPRTTTTLPPTTTTIPLRVPGLGLLPQPTPTPVPLPPTNLAPVFSQIPTPNKVIFLGIDDGIVQDPADLALLKQANIPFSMFLVKPYADAGADFWRQAQQLGGIVESHTITHPDLTTVSATQLQNEVCGTLDDYQTLFGRRPTLFRPPYGAYNDNVRAVAASCGFKAIIMWKGSTNDGRFDLQNGTQLEQGDIILMHWRTDFVENLQKVIQTCKDQGYTIASLEDYLSG